jgi:hypothetical protein
MKLAAARALADLAREPVPDAVTRAYAGTELRFGREYIIPKPLDPRLLTTVANIAIDAELLAETYPFSSLVGRQVNTLIFPNRSAGNIAYKLLHEIGGAEVIGPVLMGMARPVHVLQLGSSVREIVNMTALAVVEAQRNSEERTG